MRLFSVILGVATLLSRSGESSQVKTGESRDAQPGIAPIEFAPPSPETIPGTQLGEQIRLGYKIVVNTQEYADAYVGNRLNCTNCQLDAGLNPNAVSSVGSVSNGILTGERFRRTVPSCRQSWPISPGSRMGSRAVQQIPWRGLQRIDSRRPLGPGNGKNLFASKCAFCHGSDGQGTMAGPPVWGPQSYNIAADMARVTVAAAFIKSNMPRGWGWSLSDDDAYDVAAYVNSRPRPDFPNKVHDWTKGGKPADSPY